MCVEQSLEAAKGWLDLGLPDEALYELEALQHEDRSSLPALELRLRAEMEDKRWNPASDTARMLCIKHAEEPRFFLYAAFCLHETGDTYAACNWLLSGPKTLRGMPVFHYNIACYLWTLGQGSRARSHLRMAFEMDGGLREVALKDSDLRGIDSRVFSS